MKQPSEITINGNTLDVILTLHIKWIGNESGGIRAYLRDAYLHDADLHDADLSGANLSGANLSGANLRDAYLRDAYLHDADLHDADLSGANLSGANLSGAYLSGANLSGANLSGANLSGANLSGANLSGAEDIVAIGPIGSRGDIIFAVRHEKVIMIKTGCFWGTLTQFKTQVKATHKTNEYAQAYGAAIVFIRKYFATKEK